MRRSQNLVRLLSAACLCAPFAVPGKADDGSSALQVATGPAPKISKLADGAKAFKISVTDPSGKKLPEFLVIAGVGSNSIAAEYEKRTGRTVVNWQPHTVQIGKEGIFDWPLDRSYDPMYLRVESAGYQPQTADPIKKVDGPRLIEFQLAPDKGVAGRILTPTGKPAANATIALALTQKDAVWENGALRGAGQPLAEKPGDRWRRPLFVNTDGEGQFTLPSESEPAALLIVHDSGVKELAYDDFRKAPQVMLDPWGKVEGQVLWKDKPGADDEVTLSVYRDQYGYPGMIASYAKTQTDKEGRFTFEKALPGLTQISRPSKPKKPASGGITQAILPTQFAHVNVKQGEPTRMLIGGQGRLVKGKFVGRDSWNDVTFHFHPTAPHVGFPGDDAQWQAFAELKQSPIGSLLFRDKQPVNAGGTFEIKDMLPGSYQLFVTVPGIGQNAGYTKIDVEPELPGVQPATLDVGNIPVKSSAGTKSR